MELVNSWSFLTRLRWKLLLAFFIMCSPTLPKSRPLFFNHLTVDNGLSQNSVYAILEDHQGFMWFGTADGLDQYD